MIKDYFWHQLDVLDLKDMWFQQDGETCHTSAITIDLLRERFQDRVISRNGDVQWPPRSCDITPLDFFLWGYVKIVQCLLFAWDEILLLYVHFMMRHKFKARD